MKEVLQEVLKSQDEFERLLWVIVAHAVDYHDRGLFEAATQLDALFDKIFVRVKEVVNPPE